MALTIAVVPPKVEEQQFDLLGLTKAQLQIIEHALNTHSSRIPKELYGEDWEMWESLADFMEERSIECLPTEDDKD